MFCQCILFYFILFCKAEFSFKDFSLVFTFTFSHFADAFIQSDLQLGNT